MTIEELARHGYSFRGSSVSTGTMWCCSLEVPDAHPGEQNPKLFFGYDLAAVMEEARVYALTRFVERRLS